MDSRDDRKQGQRTPRAGGERGAEDMNTSNNDITRGVFRTMGSRDRDVILVGRTIDLGEPWGDGNLG